MSTYLIIQARTGSTRLPNKMLMPFYENKGILEILIERIKHALPNISEFIVVATTTNIGDDDIEQLCKRIDVKYYRGSENDVLKRFIDSASYFDAEKIIRICADNVFLDTRLLNQLINKMGASNDDYISYCTNTGIPSIKTHYGFWAEGVTRSALERINDLTKDPLYHEHVTNYIYTHPNLFSINFQNINETIPGIEDHPNIRLTIDTQEDFDISKNIYEYLQKNGQIITSENIIDYIERNPEFYSKMKKIINQNSK